MAFMGTLHRDLSWLVVLFAMIAISSGFTGSTRCSGRPSRRNRSGNRRAACMGRISAAHPGRRSRDGPSVAPRCASVGYRITTRKDGPA